MRAHYHEVNLLRSHLAQDATGRLTPFGERLDDASTRGELVGESLQVGPRLRGQRQVVFSRLDEVDRNDSMQHQLCGASLREALRVRQRLLGKWRSIQWNENGAKHMSALSR